MPWWVVAVVESEAAVLREKRQYWWQLRTGASKCAGFIVMQQFCAVTHETVARPPLFLLEAYARYQEVFALSISERGFGERL